MRKCRENCLPKFGKKYIFQIIMTSIVQQRKVLTMEEVPGVPIRSTLKSLVEEYAARKEGKTGERVQSRNEGKIQRSSELGSF